MSDVDEETGTLIVVVEDSKATESIDIYREKIKGIVGDVPMIVGTGHLTFTACNSRTSDCSPLIGGIQVEYQVSSSTIASQSLSMGDTNLGGKKGLIIAGHMTGFGVINKDIGQATTGRIVGKVITNPSGPRTSDSAFVEFKKDASGNYIYTANENQIYKTSSSVYTIVGKKTSSDVPLNSAIRIHSKHGSYTGFVIGRGLTFSGSWGTLTQQSTMDAVPVGGDSGAAVTVTQSGSNVYYHGIVVGSVQVCTPTCTNYGVFSTWENIKSELGLTS